MPFPFSAAHFAAALFSAFLVLSGPLPSFAQGLPSDRRSDWYKAGLAAPSPALLREKNALDFGALPDDTLADATAIQLALTALAGNPGMVYLPPGTYLIDHPIDLPSGAVLRGAGADSTLLVIDFGGADLDAIRIGSAETGSDWYLSQIPAKGDQTIRLPGITAAAAGLQAGDWVEIVQDNGSWDEAPAGWAAESVGHISQIRAIAADSLMLADACRIDFTAADQPRLRRISPVSSCGLECLRLTRSDAGGDGAMIWFYLAVNSWVSGVESFKSAGAHVLAARSAHLDISGNYFHEAWEYDGDKTHGYGVALVRHTVATLVQDNVFRELRHAMIVKQGANGNVFGYNYSLEPHRSEPVSDFSGDLSLHGHYPFANLFEGNTVQNIFTDNYWGPSGPGNTFYRNRVQRYGIVMTSAATHEQNYVGNDLTGAAPFYGSMLLSGSGHLSSGNLVRGMAEPPGTPLSGSPSWYLQTAPVWWDATDPWPVSGFGTTGKLPAQLRFETLLHPSACRTARCQAPRHLEADSTASDFAILSWAAVSGAESYGWRGRLAAGGPYRYRNTIGSLLELSSGLDPGMDYAWQVRARCAFGYSHPEHPIGSYRESPPSSWSSFSTPGTALKSPERDARNGVPEPLGTQSPLLVYPNPVPPSGSFQLECSGFWTLTDAQGRVLRQGTGPAHFSASDFSPGVYSISNEWNATQFFLLP